MEVSTVFPHRVSPTEGDALCEADVTSMAIHSVTLLICICGLAGNGAVLHLISLKSRNYGIFDMAVTDFLFLLLTVPSSLLFLVEDMSCSPLVSLLYMNFLFKLSLVSYYWGLSRLMLNSTMLYMYTFCKFSCRWDLPERLWWIVGSVQSWAFLAVLAVMPTIFLCPSHKQEQCQELLIILLTLILLLLAAAVVIYRTILFFKAKWGSQQQQPKRRDIVIVLIVLFTLLLSLWNFLQLLGYIAVPTEVFYLLTCLHSSIKPFIYFLVGTCRRPCSVGSLQLSLQRVFEELKEKTDHINDPVMDRGLSLLIPSTAEETQ